MEEFQARQGDVFVRRAKAVPVAAALMEAEAGRVILAHGEVTGHAHALSAERVKMFRDDGLARSFITVQGGAPAPLQHEEHGTVALAAGDYEVIRQVEYSPEAIRQVAD